MSISTSGIRLQPGMEVDAAGHLHFGGLSLVKISERYGTPLLVLNEQTVRENCRKYQRALEYYPNSLVVYASKAFLCQAICSLIKSEGLGLDIVSGGELYTAQSAGVPGELIIFHGVNRSLAELTDALNYGVGRIVVDNRSELQRVAEAACLTGTRAEVLLRVTTGVAPHTHSYVQTSLTSSKFGFALSELRTLLAEAADCPDIRIQGLHSHIGSQIMTAEPFIENLTILMQTAASLRCDRLPLNEINIGGGLGSYYCHGDRPVAIEDLVHGLTETATRLSETLGMPLPRLIFEPGRSIINDAGVTLYSVGGSKEIPGGPNYLFVDGSMADNIRPALYNSRYEAVLANRMSERRDTLYTIAGRCCESGDILAWNQLLPRTRPGDILAITRTGAYTVSMASNYNHLPRPAIVLVSDKKADLIVERETYADINCRDRIPAHLR